MEQLLSKVSELYMLNKDNSNVISKLEFYVLKQLPGLIDKYCKQEKKKQLLESESKKYINDFLISPEKRFFYIEQTDIFIKYDGETYSHLGEDEFWYFILNDITNTTIDNPDFNLVKQKTKNKIVEEVKKRSVFQTIPESHTVQLVIQFFTPTIFDTKEDVKHFLCLIGDNLHGKKNNNNYLVPKCSKPFFEAIENLCEYFFQSKMNIQSNIKYRYRGQDFKNCRVIYFTKSIKNKSCWISFLKENFLNFIVVCSHYSNRYVSADNYVEKQTKNFKNRIFYLKNHNKKDIVDEFAKNMLIDKQNSSIKWEDIYFLWKFYIKTNNMPNMIYKADFENIIRKKYTHNNNTFHNLSSDSLKNVELFKEFYSNFIINNNDDSLEVSEMHKLICKWLETKHHANFSEEELKDMIEYFYSDITIENDKFILGVSCKLWDKQKDIIESIENKFNKKITTDKSIYDIYVMYCKYSNNNNKILTVSKDYFYDFVYNFIPANCIKNGKILKAFWE